MTRAAVAATTTEDLDILVRMMRPKVPEDGNFTATAAIPTAGRSIPARGALKAGDPVKNHHRRDQGHTPGMTSGTAGHVRGGSFASHEFSGDEDAYVGSKLDGDSRRLPRDGHPDDPAANMNAPLRDNGQIICDDVRLVLGYDKPIDMVYAGDCLNRDARPLLDPLPKGLALTGAHRRHEEHTRHQGRVESHGNAPAIDRIDAFRRRYHSFRWRQVVSCVTVIITTIGP
ncbi:MAG: hypothetical protein HBSAPP03_05210 [Phycisphaerae bacterium]|nr:MAG: hypothetical protein HBSAPP03_05210 [Phycisphaerae bacterium]